MASAVSTQKFRFHNKLEMWDHDPGVDTALVASPDGGTTQRWFDMSQFGGFVAAALATIATAGITKLEIVAADDEAGTNATVVKDSGTIAADAVGDWAVLECLAQEVRQLSEENGYSLRYVAARITMGDAGDEAVVAYLGFDPRFPRDGLTPATTIAA